MKKAKDKKRKGSLIWLAYAWLAVFIIAYALSGRFVIGLLSLVTIIVILILEVKASVRSEGIGKSVIDIATAVGAAVLVWILLIFILHTSAPVDAVSSCSMLPALHRGDMVVLMGIDNFSKFISTHHLPVANVSSASFQSMESNMSSEFLTFYAYSGSNLSAISDIVSSSQPKVSLYNTKCLSTYTYAGNPSGYARCAVPSQNSNLIKYNYSIGKVSIGGTQYGILYTSGISAGKATIKENYSNPVIVYQTTSKDSFSGSIIHRVFAALNVSGKYYFLTKGDNNQALDIEFGNYPVNESSTLGYVIADIPLLGYVKLILSGQIAVPQGCNQTILH